MDDNNINKGVFLMNKILKNAGIYICATLVLAIFIFNTFYQVLVAITDNPTYMLPLIICIIFSAIYIFSRIETNHKIWFENYFN